MPTAAPVQRTMMYSHSPDTGLVMTVNGETVVNVGPGVIDALLRAWQRGDDLGTLEKIPPSVISVRLTDDQAAAGTPHRCPLRSRLPS